MKMLLFLPIVSTVLHSLLLLLLVFVKETGSGPASKLTVSKLLLQRHPKVEDAPLKRQREDLQGRVDFLQKQADVRVQTSRVLSSLGHFHMHSSFLIQHFTCSEL